MYSKNCNWIVLFIKTSLFSRSRHSIKFFMQMTEGRLYSTNAKTYVLCKQTEKWKNQKKKEVRSAQETAKMQLIFTITIVVHVIIFVIFSWNVSWLWCLMTTITSIWRTSHRSFFIPSGNPVVFIPVTLNNLLLVDSNLHGQTGAFVVLCERRHIYELSRWYTAFNKFPALTSQCNWSHFPKNYEASNLCIAFLHTATQV